MVLRDIKKAWRSLQTDGFARTAKKAARKLKYGSGGGQYAAFIQKYEPSRAELALQKKTQFANMPKISFLCPAYNTKPEFAKAMIQSVLVQTYANWELVIADAGEEKTCSQALKTLAKADGRVRYLRLQENLGIALNTAEAAEAASGEIFAFLDHDDTLAPFAAFELAKAVNEHSEADFFYSDEDKMDNLGRFDPHFKPKWSPDTLKSYNYITHLMAMTKALYVRCGGMRPGYDGSQDHDLALRATEMANQIVHIPKVLYHWRAHKGSVAGNGAAKSYANEAGLKAAEWAAKSENEEARAEQGLFRNSYRVRYPLAKQPKVSVVIPNRDAVELLRPCVETVLATKEESSLELIVVENGSKQPEIFDYYRQLEQSGQAKIVRFEGAFNYSAANNLGARHASGDLLLFLNNDVQAMEPGWLTAMAEHAKRPTVGAVGAKLLFSDGSIQHAGVVVGMNGWADHVCAGLPADGGGRFAASHLVNTVRNVSAVTGACMMVEKSKFDVAGGFDEGFILCGSDVEFCLRLLSLGFVNIYTPFACLKHLESVTRKGSPIPESDFARSKEAYAPYLASGDPYYSVNYDYQSKLPRIKP
ncbi:MAG: glycosyltransferase family 2 protein [Christensenellales bacterium]|jgi:GT2 family glycosyltransferase